MTPEQISKAAFDASGAARTADQFLAAAELHRAALETGEPRYRGGHSLAVANCTLRAKAKRSGEGSREEARILRGLRDAAQIGR